MIYHDTNFIVSSTFFCEVIFDMAIRYVHMKYSANITTAIKFHLSKSQQVYLLWFRLMAFKSSCDIRTILHCVVILHGGLYSFICDMQPPSFVGVFLMTLTKWQRGMISTYIQ